jgi:hypothetical protein
VAHIVRACTDGTAEGKNTHTTPEAKRADWLRRKQEYLKHLANEDDEVLLVSGCDKLHNARAIVQDLESPAVGRKMFDRFTGGCRWQQLGVATIEVPLDMGLRAPPACFRLSGRRTGEIGAGAAGGRGSGGNGEADRRGGEAAGPPAASPRRTKLRMGE